MPRNLEHGQVWAKTGLVQRLPFPGLALQRTGKGNGKAPPRSIKDRARRALGNGAHAHDRSYLLGRLIPALREQAGDERLAAAAFTQTREPRLQTPGGHDVRLPPAGTVLTRDFKGRTYEVTVLEAGFEYDGRTWPSLSRVARAITGTPWNGYSFFRLGRVG